MFTILKYYIRLDASKRPVLGTIILRKNMTKIGNWKRISIEE